jgi:hypothetical protein
MTTKTIKITKTTTTKIIITHKLSNHWKAKNENFEEIY